MLVLACGSRSWTDAERIGKAFDDYDLAGRRATVLHGDARGADKLAGREAKARGIPVERMPANWRPGGVFDPDAGFKRNTAMLDRNPDLVIAFWDGRSGGTWDTVTKARERKIMVIVVDASRSV